jgi:thiamine-phosphate pyrophosphorylase
VIPLPRLYAIADASFSNPVDLAQALFDAGVRLLQVRNKSSGARELLDQVERILSVAPSGAAVIVNDRVDVAKLAGAAGVHLGQTDIPAGSARQILGKDRIIGWSTHNLDQAVEAEKLPVDYWKTSEKYSMPGRNPLRSSGICYLHQTYELELETGFER